MVEFFSWSFDGRPEQYLPSGMLSSGVLLLACCSLLACSRSDAHATEASSSYKAKSKVQSRPQSPRDEPCAYCGTRGHGKNAPTRTRRVECPAFGTTCDSCGRNHHFEKVYAGASLPRDRHSLTPVVPYFMASVPWRRQATRIR